MTQIEHMEPSTKKYLLALARSTIAAQLKLDNENPGICDDLILKEERGVFVTLHINGLLRGCIGNIMPVYKLEEAVKNNAVSAAFHDPRFLPLSPAEFKEIDLEISVLTVPKKINYQNTDDLLAKLEPLKHGVILKHGYNEATYLPQVWEDLRDKEIFLSSLCNKAGLNGSTWKSGRMEVSVYEAEIFREKK